MNNGRVLTCVYCGQEYPQDTPAHGSEVLTEHIRTCQSHPLRKAERDIARLRDALVGLVGADTEPELKLDDKTRETLSDFNTRMLAVMGGARDMLAATDKATKADPVLVAHEAREGKS